MNPPQAYLDAFKALEEGGVERSVDARISVEGGDGKAFAISDVPELPHKVGEDETPCRCFFAAKYQ